MTPRPGAATAAGLAIVAAVALFTGHGDPARLAHPARLSASCAPVVLTDAVTDATVSALLAAGWRGDPTDRREALYPPGCVD